ncbi:MAG TPA: hypothetical protein VGP47_02350 [Parachlamydiaceae bacterium]|nr:hypothetical protein [Parachlamydiaceae bacterium]
MGSISNKSDHTLLDSIPDFIEWNKARRWMEEGQKLLDRSLESKLLEKEIVSLEWGQIEQNVNLPFGRYESGLWRKFVLATFFSDYVSYSHPIDRVNFERLLFVMHAFPEGFRTWWTKLSDGNWWPVGYSGWYPMLETAFELFEKSPHKLKDRMVVPSSSIDREGAYLYLFNYSVAPLFKGSVLPKMLIKALSEDIKAQNGRGLACVTVSEDGVRVAKRFGMAYAGDLVLDGSIEAVYAVRTKK